MAYQGNPQYIDLVTSILKENYLPAWDNLIGIEPSPFLEKIKKVPLTNRTISAAAPWGLNGGVGYGDDGTTTPASGPQKFSKFTVDAKALYCNLEISDMVVKLASSNKSAMIDVLDTEVKSGFASTKWNMGRSLFMDGKGILAHIGASASSATEITVDDVRFFREGMLVDCYGYASAAATDGTIISGGPFRILNVDRSTKKIKISGNGITASTALTGTTDYGFITLQNSYKKEFTGLGAIFDSNATGIYGNNYSDYPWLKPITVDANHAISDIVITNGMRDSKQFHNGNIDMLLFGDDAFTEYQTYMKEDNASFVTSVNNLNFKGGHTGFEVLFGNQRAVCVNESFVPKGEIWGVNTKDWEFHHTTFDFVAYNSSIFTLVPNHNYYRALLATYGNLICKNPGGCVRFTNCDAAS